MGNVYNSPVEKGKMRKPRSISLEKNYWDMLDHLIEIGLFPNRSAFFQERVRDYILQHKDILVWLGVKKIEG